MKERNIYIFLCVTLLLLGLFACSEFDLPSKSPFKTYIKTFGSSDFDLAFDAIYLEAEDSYLVVGSSGPLETEARAFIAKIDRQSGSFTDYKIVGTNFDRTESLKHIIETKNKDFKAVGFSQIGGESRMLLTSFNSDLKEIKVDSINGNNWEEGNNILEIEDDFLISGSWGNNLGGVHEFNKQPYIGEEVFGRIQDAFYDSRGYGIMVGHFCPRNNCRFNRIYLTQYIPEFNNIFHKNDTIHPPKYENAALQAITQIAIDSSYIAIGKAWNNKNNNKIILVRFDFGLNPIGDLVVYDSESNKNYFGDNASARDIVAVEDGVVITGFEGNADNTNTDLLVAKFDFNGNFIWKKTYDEKSQEDVGWAILDDGEGFFVVGQTRTSLDTAENSSVLFLKTDVEGIAIK